MSITEQEVADVIGKIQELKRRPPENTLICRQLKDNIRELSLILETPLETSQRIFFSPLQITIARAASDLGIFELMSRQADALSIDDLVSATKAERQLLSEYCCSDPALSRSDGHARSLFRNNIPSNKNHSDFGRSKFKAGLNHHFDIQLPSWLALPAFLRSTGCSDPTDPCQTPFQIAHKTNLPAFEWAAAQPQRSWLDAFSPEDLQKSSNTPILSFFVDVGGGVGHQCSALKARIPNPAGGIILQDLPEVLAHARPTKGVEQMSHNFWTEQPIRGASYYYLRNILHDHPDSACATFLENIGSAMSKESTILIDEIVLLDVGAQWQAAQLDMGMMASLAGRERTKADWERVVEGAGLTIKGISVYEDEIGSSIIVVVKP
ncbi:MAG: hypothetical protein Q9166_004977 [cf. Caloplaca sp. 2 TL-2023]